MYTTEYNVKLLIILSVLVVLIKKGCQGNVICLIVGLIATYIVLCSEFVGWWLRTQSIFATSREIVPIGSGWSFYLNKASIGNVIRAESGQIRFGWWGAGTTIKELQNFLTSKNETLSAYPSIENGTLGGWIASGSHGSGGTLWRSCFDNVRVKHLSTGKISIAPYKQYFNDSLSISQQQKYMILEVEVIPVDNVCVKRNVFKMTSLKDAISFIQDESYLRMIQIGKRGIMCILWIPSVSKKCVDKRSQLNLWMQTDVLSIFQSQKAQDSDWFEYPIGSAEYLSSECTLAQANAFTYEPPILLTPIGLLYQNFEIFVLNYHTSPETLFTLSNAISELFVNMHGRCELRCGTKKLFLDFVLTRNTVVRPVFDLILKVLGRVDICLHKGKAQVDTAPL